MKDGRSFLHVLVSVDDHYKSRTVVKYKSWQGKEFDGQLKLGPLRTYVVRTVVAVPRRESLSPTCPSTGSP